MNVQKWRDIRTQGKSEERVATIESEVRAELAHDWQILLAQANDTLSRADTELTSLAIQAEKDQNWALLDAMNNVKEALKALRRRRLEMQHVPQPKDLQG